jgi:hypothetical protein
MNLSRIRLATLAVLAFVAIAFSGADASAQRAARARTGVKTKTWKANGVKFRHKTHGNSKIGWERHATGKSGVTKISGKLWGSKIRGTEAKKNGVTTSKITATSKDGKARTTTTVTNKKGTERKSIEMKPEGVTRKITTWRVGNTRMQATRDYDSQSGALLKRQRTGYKARK